ncbi:ATP-binding domain-containing protein (plasmid) [Tunturibacter empetritectus]|uniref:ATP-binding domain-containing protein n=2 Tax=Tunturiibacter empetritectus TaxID=3069691 RepID=A0AAU7ZIL1_9BACT
MTIHQAKNREFDGVVIVWPYQVAGDLDQKRRLLYNGVTRARHWCVSLVQGNTSPANSPFE